MALAQAAGNVGAEKIQREFFNLFIGVGRGELVPCGSYYLADFYNEQAPVRLREDLHALGIECTDLQVEGEDHAAILCETMAGLAGGPLASAAGLQQQFFQRHLAPWIGRFFADFEKSQFRRLLSPCRNGRPAIHGDRDQYIRATGLSGRESNRRTRR